MPASDELSPTPAQGLSGTQGDDYGQHAAVSQPCRAVARDSLCSGGRGWLGSGVALWVGAPGRLAALASPLPASKEITQALIRSLRDRRKLECPGCLIEAAFELRPQGH